MTDHDRALVAHGAPMLTVRRTDPAAILPAYATAEASGLDLHALGHHVVGPAWERIPTGIAVEIPPGCEGQIRPRSSATLAGLDVALGTIDADYRGEIAILARHLHGARVVQAGDRIAQLVIAPVARVLVVEGELSETERGAGGFGSTGQGAGLGAGRESGPKAMGQARVEFDRGSCGHGGGL